MFLWMCFVVLEKRVDKNIFLRWGQEFFGAANFFSAAPSARRKTLDIMLLKGLLSLKGPCSMNLNSVVLTLVIRDFAIILISIMSESGWNNPLINRF
jgi:hypothetical protein